MPRIVAADIEEVKSRINIADVIGERVALKSAGVGSLKGLCPFHDERSPSFNVRPSQGFYHCFGCGESGDVFTFLREMDHLSFSEAVELMAQRVGYELHYEEGGGPAPEKTSGRARLFAANTQAAEYFRQQLLSPEAESARAFLGGRGFDPGAAAHFGVGYAPKGWDHLLNHLTGQGFTRDELITAGLVSTNQRGGVYDRFRGRIVWPIRDVTGQTIGFGARKLYEEDQGPKYLNTPETPIYKKNQVLYGLDLAKRDISRGDPKRVIVVEGYTDVMACHLAGLTTAVATCGTAFGSEHIRTLRRVMGDDSATGEVVFTFDGDEAGQKAALRAFSEAERFSAQTFVAVAPDGLDPCDLRLQRGDQAVRGLLENRAPMIEFVIDRKIGGFPLTSVEGRVGALRAAAPIVAEIKDRLIRPGYERMLAQRLGMDPTDVHREVEIAARGGQREERQAQPAGTAVPSVTLANLPRTTDVAIERDALTGILQYGHLIEPALFQRALESSFRTPALDEVRKAILAVDRSKVGWGQAALEQLPQSLRQLGGEVLMRDFPARDEEHAAVSANDLCRRVITRALDTLKQELLGELQRLEPGSPEGRAVQIRLRDLEMERRRLIEEN